MQTRFQKALQEFGLLLRVPTKTRPLAIALAVSGVLLPGLHKFYLRQWGWGIIYLMLLPTHIPQVASLIEGLWYGTLDPDEFDYNFNAQSSLAAAEAEADAREVATPPDTSNRSRGKGQVAQGSSQSFQADLAYFTKANQSRKSQTDATATATGSASSASGWAVLLGDRPAAGTVQTEAAALQPIDVNRATLADWLRLPGLTLEQGRSLMVLQAQGVQFHCLEDLAAALSVSVEQLQPVAAMLAFYYYEPQGFNADEVQPIQPMDANQASLGALMRIPGMNTALALQIVHHRRSPYRNLADLQQRLGLKAHQIERLMHYLRF